MNQKEKFNLTNPQKSIWMTEQFYKGTSINNIVGCLKISEKVDIKALEKAVNYFIMKNDSFRTKITIDGDVPKQYFDEFKYEEYEIIDIKSDSELKEFEASFPLQNIDIYNNNLYIVKLLKLPDGSIIFAINSHHLIADAWTMSVLIDEVYNNYINIVNGEKLDLTPNPSYREYIEKQIEYIKTSKFEKDKEYWEEQFEKLPNIVSFKNNKNATIKSNRKIYSFDKTKVNQIKEFCKENKISEFIFLFSIFNIYIGNIFNYDNFVIGNPVLNRANYREKQMTGMFVSIMPFVVDIPKDITFLEFCTYIASKQRKMYKHIGFSYHEILNSIKKKHNFSEALYDIVFSYQNAKIPSYCKWLPNNAQGESIQIHVKDIAEETNTIAIHYDYLTDVFSENDIEQMNNRIQGLIEQALERPDIKIDTMEIVSNNEKSVLLEEFNSTTKLYNKNSNIIKEFEKVVEQYPQNIAVIDKNKSYTYEEINNRANYLANKIIDKKISTEIIAFSLERTADIIVTILGILKSGHTYMPIDTEYPVERIKFMLENSKSKLLITNKTFMKKIEYDINCIYFENLLFDKKTENLNLDISPEKLCYIMYTSGSTGTPKAVSIKHYNVLNFVQSMKEKLDYTMSKDNRVISVTTVCFDIFVFELYPTLLSGLCLVIADELESRSPKLLSEVIKKHKISKILTTPSRIELLFSDTKYLEAICEIKEFILGGEALSNSLLDKLQKNTKANIYNLYGPTETTVYSAFKDVTNTNEITIGKPINNTQIYILNNNNKLQPIGIIGEICIGGDGVGGGYYNNPEKTKNVFIQNPYGQDIIYKTGDLGYWKENGELVCIGRKDYQIKIRGYRIELDDISNNILKFENVEKCVVIDRQDSSEKKYLCAYLVGSKKIDIMALKKFLVSVIPNYMIPSYFIQIDEIPLTLNHKVDRKSLPDPEQSEEIEIENFVKPKTKIEKDLCKIIKECLGISKIGIENDIFDYNIDSLDIIRIQTKMLEFNYKLNTQDFYKCRTIKDLALEVENKKTNQVSEEEAKILENVNSSFEKFSYNLEIKQKEYKNILLLGCTGYLGIHLLKEIITQTNSKVTCIMRKKNNASVIERLEKLYKAYFNIELPKERVDLIDSDITKSQFGLDEKQYKNLVKKTDLAINVAANVRYYGDYKSFKKINVDVVENLIEFCNGNNIQLAQISTLGVSGNYLVKHKNNYNIFSEDDFYIGQEYTENVYIRTKFEAEKLIYEKTNENLKACIFRVGNLTSRYSDGCFQKNFEENAFYNILMMILKYHIVPNTMINEFLEFTPIEYCASAIFKILFNIDTDKHVFHIFNENYIQVSELLKIFEDTGYNTKIMTGTEFNERILLLSNQFPEENILKGIVNDLDNELGLSFNAKVNQKNSNTNYYLEKLNFYWPKITKEYINKIIEYLRNNKYLN